MDTSGRRNLGGKKVSDKKYYESNKDKISEYYKTWREDKKEHLKEYQKEYRKNNIEKIRRPKEITKGTVKRRTPFIN
jgi:mevalonate pyrophosphate decarboxylase